MGKAWATPGQVIGIFGGSFDPPHEGHVHLTLEAIKRLGLDWVWWLVSPGNPIKPDPPAPLSDRMAQCRQIMRHPRVRITDLERELGTRATVDTLRKLRRRYPHLHFVWLMGADNLASFHRWDSWQDILRTTPVAVIARPKARQRALNSRAARQFAHARLPQTMARDALAGKAPAWVFVNLPMVAQSSTALREKHAARSAPRKSQRIKAEPL